MGDPKYRTKIVVDYYICLKFTKQREYVFFVLLRDTVVIPTNKREAWLYLSANARGAARHRLCATTTTSGAVTGAIASARGTTLNASTFTTIAIDARATTTTTTTTTTTATTTTATATIASAELLRRYGRRTTVHAHAKDLIRRPASVVHEKAGENPDSPRVAADSDDHGQDMSHVLRYCYVHNIR